MAQKAAQLQRLLDLLEEHLDLPAALVKLGDARRRPFQVVRQELHLALLAVHLDDRAHQAQDSRVLLARGGAGQHDQIVAQYVAGGLLQEPLPDAILHVVLGPRDPEHAAPGQVPEMREIHVGLVEHGDFARLNDIMMFR